MNGSAFDEDAAIDHARTLLQKNCGISLPRDDAVLLVYLLAQHGIRDAIINARGDNWPMPSAPAVKTQSVPADKQVLDDLSAQLGQRVDDIEAKIGPIVDLSLAALMLGVEKSIDAHLDNIVTDCAVRLRAQTHATFRAKWFWIVMLLTGALCFGAGVVTVFAMARTLF